MTEEKKRRKGKPKGRKAQKGGRPPEKEPSPGQANPSIEEPEKSSQNPRITHRPIPEVVIYHLHEEELRIIETGSFSSIFLNLGLPILFSGVSTWIALALTKSEEPYKTILTCWTITSLLAGLILLMIWWRLRRDSRKLFDTIRNRTPQRGAPKMQDRSGQ